MGSMADLKEGASDTSQHNDTVLHYPLETMWGKRHMTDLFGEIEYRNAGRT